MVSTISQEMSDGSHLAIRAGKQIVDIVTSGMYTDSLMAIREYVQNSADAIDEAVEAGLLRPENGQIDVRLCAEDRSITILDNGVGLPSARAAELLSSIAVSSKRQHGLRGFRGIGRLGGLGYCNKVVFETRSRESELVTVVTWNGEKLREKCREFFSDEDAGNVVRDSIQVHSRRGRNEEDGHFFKVTMHGVHQFYKDQLMDHGALSTYLGRVAPVPFDFESFPFAEKVEQHLSTVEGYRNYRILVDGEQVFRPHTRFVRVHGQRFDTVGDVELIRLRGRNGHEIGRGWYAKMSYFAAVHCPETMRGMRVRQGNIEVGDEHFLADFFTERRFAVWHIGEIHVGYALRANARRDGFENSSDLETLFEQFSVLGRHLSYLCRAASKIRSRYVGVLRSLDRVESLLRQTLFLSQQHLEGTIKAAEILLSQIARALDSRKEYKADVIRLNRAQIALSRLPKKALFFNNVLDGRKLRNVEQKALLSEVADLILKSQQDKTTPEELIATILRPYVRRSVKL